MPFPLPTPQDMLLRSEARVEAAIRAARPQADPAAIARSVRSEKGMIGILLRDQVMTAFETHLHLRWLGDQWLPDTAEAEFLIRHASIWGVFKRPAVKAVGFAGFTGVPGTAIPVDLDMRLPGGGLALTSAGGVIALDGTLTLALVAAEGGTAADTSGGQRLPLVTTLAGLDPQSALLDADGMQGGADEESDISLLARVLAVIREPGHGGAAFDYPKWVQNAFAAAKVRTLPNWVGAGSVGVCIAMGTAAEPRVPSPAEIDAIAVHLDVLRPVTAEVIVLAVQLLPTAFTLAVAPDTVAVRGAVEAALGAYIAAEAEIGMPLYRSRISEAISAASGEYRHYLLAPAGDIAPAPRQLILPGALTWDAPP